MQKLPSSGPLRELLREKGQFWTPPWLAKVMASWVIADKPSMLFDPAVGPGAFFAAAKDSGFDGQFTGFEIDESAIAQCYELGLTSPEMNNVVIGDFISKRLISTFPAIISNPPYIRHHRLDEQRKLSLRNLATRILGFPLDGRVGLHLYFLLKCLEVLSPGGRLAFLLPADVCEGVSSAAVWKRISERFRIDAVLTFCEDAAPFPNVDTNALVFLISNQKPAERVPWLRVLQPDHRGILCALEGKANQSAAVVHWRNLEELVTTGISRPPRDSQLDAVPLSAFAKVVRGIATGANEFFFLNSQQMNEFGLPLRFFRRAIGRTRDCPGAVLKERDLNLLDSAGRPTWLLNLGKESRQDLPQKLREYLDHGERLGFPGRPLIETRKPWFRMENRTPPPLLFAYLGRRDCRFILNKSGAVPLTGFLCIYPWETASDHVERLWRALNHADTLANLIFVAKSYGSGALKVEPRQLDGLEIPKRVLVELKLTAPQSWRQPTLLEQPCQSSAAEVLLPSDRAAKSRKRRA